MVITMAQSFIDQYEILWQVYSVLLYVFFSFLFFNFMYNNSHFSFRFKAVIRLTQATVANLFGVNHLRMNSNRILFTKAEVSCRWQIQVQIPTDLNCKIKIEAKRKGICILYNHTFLLIILLFQFHYVPIVQTSRP